MPITYTLYAPNTPLPATSPSYTQHIPTLLEMINSAFDSQDRSCYGPTNIFPGKVLRSEDDLENGYGELGACVVAFDEVERMGGESEVEVEKWPVATAGVKPWKGVEVEFWREFLGRKGETGGEGEEGGKGKNREDALKFKEVLRGGRAGDVKREDEGGDDAQVNETRIPVPTTFAGVKDWSLVLVASRADPKYRRQGLVSRCISMLEDYLSDMRRQAIEKGEMAEEDLLPVWLTALDGDSVGNVAYYGRRGFEVYSIDQAPDGMWGALGPFRVATMRKILK